MTKNDKNIEDEIEKNIEMKFESWADGRCGGKRHVFWRVFWGLFFIVAAGAIAAQIFGWLTFSINIWWLVLAIFLFAMMIASIANLNWFGVFMPLACIVTIVNYQTNWFNLNLSGQEIGGVFIIAGLLSIAFSILFHRKSYHKLGHRVGLKNAENFSRKTSSDDEREVTIAARLGEAVRYIESNQLEKVFIDCVMGSIKVYFNNAELTNSELVVNVQATMSGIEMYVPRSWRVVTDLNVVAGGVDEKNHAKLTADSPVMRLTGNMNLGGIEIIYI